MTLPDQGTIDSLKALHGDVYAVETEPCTLLHRKPTRAELYAFEDGPKGLSEHVNYLLKVRLHPSPSEVSKVASDYPALLQKMVVQVNDPLDFEPAEIASFKGIEADQLTDEQAAALAADGFDVEAAKMQNRRAGSLKFFPSVVGMFVGRAPNRGEWSAFTSTKDAAFMQSAYDLAGSALLYPSEEKRTELFDKHPWVPALLAADLANMAGQSIQARSKKL